MFALRALFALMFLVGGSFQQAPTLKCESDLPPPSFGMYYSGFPSRTNQKCTFSFVKSLADIDRAKAATYISNRERIVAIAFMNSSLSQLPDKMFSTYMNIKRLDASHLVLSEGIVDTAFAGTNAWETIDLSYNSLKTILARTFATLKVKFLDLSYNEIETIDEKAFQGADVDKLDLSHNKLKAIKFLNSFSYFDVVELSSNFLDSFQLETKKDGFSTARGIFGTVNPPKIFLQENKFSTFDCSSTIRIGTVVLSQNPALAELKMNSCDIDVIDVTDCTNLKKVSLNDNLVSFTARDVKLNDFEVGKATSLRSLSLKNASLTASAIESIMKMENLTVLDLSYNNIGALNESTFAKLKNLQKLALKASNISNIVFGTFSHQHVVETLDISDNNLGVFDMNMIFSMSALTTLDISGNDLESLVNVESAHFTFTALSKIDLTNNKWACSYLMRIIKILRVYKVNLARSNVEETGTNIHGIKCVHHQGDENLIEPLSPETKNLTELRDKMNELIEEVGKITVFKNSIDSRMKQVEQRVDNQVITFSAQRAEKSQVVEVKNSAVLESSLTIICLCLLVFIAFKLVVFIKRNFISRAKPMPSYSERHLAMTVDDF